MYFKRQEDICWYRRARQCTTCSSVFLTGELDESFLDELVSLRNKLVAKRQAVVDTVRKANPWIERLETIPKDIAEGLLRKSCWWLTHSSGKPIRAPGHADHLYLDSRHGWAVDFGANTFLVGKAIERAARPLKGFLDAVSAGEAPAKERLIQNVRDAIAGAVANYDGNEYLSNYPVRGSDLVFGAQAVDLNDAVSYLLQKVDVDRLLKPLA